MEHAVNIYTHLCLCTVVISIEIHISIIYEIPLNDYVILTGTLVFFVILEEKPIIFGTTELPRLFYLLGFASTMGLLMVPFIEPMVKTAPDIIATSFEITVLVFAYLSSCAWISETGCWLCLESQLFEFQRFLIFLDIGVVLFGEAYLLDQINLYLGLPVMAAYVLYDTQYIINEEVMGNNDHILHTMYLLVDLVGIYARVPKIMLQWRMGQTAQTKARSIDFFY